MTYKQIDREREFEAMFRMHYTGLYHHALDFLGDAEQARDIVSELFSDLWSHSDKYDPEQPAGYLHRALRNRCINHIRHATYADEAMRQYALERARMIDPDPSAHEEKLQRVESAIDELPDKTRYILEQCYMEGKKYKELAVQMDISPGMVHKHISKAMAILRKKFRE